MVGNNDCWVWNIYCCAASDWWLSGTYISTWTPGKTFSHIRWSYVFVYLYL